MGEVSVQHLIDQKQSFAEKQCYNAAYDLIRCTIDIKKRYPTGAGYPSLLSDPEVYRLVERLESWTDLLVARDGGL